MTVLLKRRSGFIVVVAASALALSACGRVASDGKSAPAGSGSAGQAMQTSPGGSAGSSEAEAGHETALGGATSGARASLGGSAGTSDAGGASASGASGRSESGGAAGSVAGGGFGGQRVADGFHCQQLECAAGELCMFCPNEYFCSPNPKQDPDGYAAAVAHCEPSVDEVPEGSYVFGDCDGPEDCADGEYCVATRDQLTSLHCSKNPGLPPVDCSCLGCWDEHVGVRTCTLCRSDWDCGAGSVCTERTAGLWNNDVRTCGPAL